MEPEEINDIIRAKIEACDRAIEEIYQALGHTGRVVLKQTGRALSLWSEEDQKEIEGMIEAIEQTKRALELMLERRENERIR